ncbi:MAG: hypothetical protein NW703_13215 [Nitrospiraceae bacterium]
MYPIKVYQVHRPAEGERKVTEKVDPGLHVEWGSGGDGQIKVAVESGSTCGCRTKENRQGHGRMAREDLLDLALDRGDVSGVVVWHG